MHAAVLTLMALLARPIAPMLAPMREIATGADLARALADDTLDEAFVVNSYLTLTNSDFAGLPTVVTRTRNFRVSAQVGGNISPLLHCVRPFAKGRVVLSSNVTLTFQGCTVYKCREGFAQRVPGYDFLAPSPPNTTGALFYSVANNALYDYCFPLGLSLLDLRHTPRPPELPGNGSQIAEEVFPAADCVRDVSSSIIDPVDVFLASLMRTGITNRCWAGIVFTADVGMYGADWGVGGASYRNNYLWRATQGMAFCRFVVPESCVATLGLVGCSNRASSNISAVKAEFGGLEFFPIQNNSVLPPNGPADNGNGDKDDSGRLVGILVGSIVGACVSLLAAVLVAVLWLRCRRRESAESELTPIDSISAQPQFKTVAATEESPVSSSPLTSKQVSPTRAALQTQQPDAPITPATPYRTGVLTELRLLEGDLVLLPKTLGIGTFGRVVLGRYKGVPVAVKQLEVGLASPEGAAAAADASGDGVACKAKTFHTELEVLARVSHPHVLRLLAASLGPPRPLLVTELMETSLEQLLHGGDSGGELLPLPKVLHISMQIAQALAYLHPTIIHRDLKPSNILLSSSSCDVPLVKIADFGLSRLVMASGLVTENPEAGTAAYMAPETFDLSTETLTDRVDVYAAGILLWEMLSGQRPWATARNVVEVAYQVTVRQLRPPTSQLPQGRCPARLLLLMQDCWAADPARRPAAAELAKRLALTLEVMAHDPEARR